MQIEFITERKISNLKTSDELFDFIIDRVLKNRILLMEREFNPEERLELMTRGLVAATTDTSAGINMVQIPIHREIKTGLGRSKHATFQFNIFAPGTSQIDQMEDGHYAVKDFNGEIIAEV
ncbi:MAG: DUF2073 domain-containing protein [Candidatus Heimdallarchaeota archaeon]|nr:DUF2073 domain-containing protein [Candidatus Heimdallarchaeota archaeon]